LDIQQLGTVDQVHHLIRQQLARGVPGKKIFVGGFSQGVAVALDGWIWK
jgi:predicted esterase